MTHLGDVHGTCDRRLVREALVGIDVRHHPIAAERVMETAAWNGTSCVAIAAVDNAMWDAKAKCLGMPLHALLGTRHLSLPLTACRAKNFR